MAQPIASAEWDFADLLRIRSAAEERQELRCAIFYEYARESVTVRAVAHEFLARSKADIAHFVGGAEVSGLRDELEFFSALPLAVCILGNEQFPHRRWLDLDGNLRRELIQKSTRISTLFELEDPHECDVPRISSASCRRLTGTVEKFIIAIDWAAGSNDEIIAAFGDWVRHDGRPISIPAPRTDASRENVTRAFLSRLAVARLLHAYAHDRALSLAADHAIPMPKQQGKAAQSRRSVQKDIRRIFHSDQFARIYGRQLIPVDEKPLCWALAQRKRGRNTARTLGAALFEL